MRWLRRLRVLRGRLRPKRFSAQIPRVAEVWDQTLTTLSWRQLGRNSPGVGDLMLERPRFKPHLRVEVVPGEGAFVLSGGSQTLLRGRLYERVVPYLGAAGRRTMSVTSSRARFRRPKSIT